MADSVLDWESIVHENVRSKDFDDAGNEMLSMPIL